MAQMAEAFDYGSGPDRAAEADWQGRRSGAAASISIFADRHSLRSELGDRALETGLVLRQAEPLARLLDGEAVVLGDIVIIDAPSANAELLAAFARLDMRAARSGCQLIVSTDAQSLDATFACFDQSGAQILVGPSAAERALALGSALARISKDAVNELTGEDRVALVRLTEQVQLLARRMEGLAGHDDVEGLDGEVSGEAHRLQSPTLSYMPRPVADSGWGDKAEPKLPSAVLVREIIRQRQLRNRFFDPELFADPAWDILLDLTAARGERKQVSVSSLCIAACVPPTTALRWIGQMTEAGLLERVRDPADRRRAFIDLSDRARQAMSAYFHRLDNGAAVV